MRACVRGYLSYIGRCVSVHIYSKSAFANEERMREHGKNVGTLLLDGSRGTKRVERPRESHDRKR